MARVLHLIENGSYRYNQCGRIEICSLQDAGHKRVENAPDTNHQASDLPNIYNETFQGQIEWGEYSALA